MIASTVLRSALVAISALTLGACGSSADDGSESERGEKAGLALAVAAPMMADPDLASRNLAHAAIAGGGPPVIAPPPVARGPEEIAAAKSEADKLAGGSVGFPPESDGAPDPALQDGVTAAQRAAAIRGPGSNCGAKADYALGWSLKLPAALPIYPRGHLLDCLLQCAREQSRVFGPLSRR
jgi:hypothetical protein